MVRKSNPDTGEILRSCPACSWGPHSVLYNGYRLSFPGLKRQRSCVDHASRSISEVKERVELYLYSPFGFSWPILRRNLPELHRVFIFCKVVIVCWPVQGIRQSWNNNSNDSQVTLLLLFYMLPASAQFTAPCATPLTSLRRGSRLEDPTKSSILLAPDFLFVLAHLYIKCE
jgi:hypothetical protein